jgi:hypothetical protein
MNGELAQYFALATHATARLPNPQAATTGLDASHSALQFVAAITFDGIPGVGSWVRHLADTGTCRVWLAAASLDPEESHDALAAHYGAAFAGGMRVGLLTTGSDRNRLWHARWQVGDRDAPDRRIWTVAYESHPVGFGPRRPDLGQAAQTLDQALQHAEEFSVHHDLQPWAGLFAQARRQWSGDGDPQGAYHRDLFPEGWGSRDSRRLADMAQAAWVFEGMGSWNDLVFTDSDLHGEYEQISRDLFAAVLRACVAAANAESTLA